MHVAKGGQLRKTSTIEPGLKVEIETSAGGSDSEPAQHTQMRCLIIAGHNFVFVMPGDGKRLMELTTKYTQRYYFLESDEPIRPVPRSE